MNNDAQEAAMGLLSLSPSNLPPPPPLVPLKRKHPPTSTGSTSAKRRPTTKLVHPPQPQPTQEGDVSTEAISCICGSTFDDGFSIACDDCSRWCHAACFDIVSGEVPEEWRCWECVPRPVDRERAVRLQKERQGLRALEEQQVASTQAPSQPQLSHPPQRRRTSPGLERKHRRTSAPAIDGSNTSKRKRRASFVVPPPPPPAAEEDADVVVDIDEPWSHSYVHIQDDILPARETREKLLRHAQSWRGITAVAPFPPPSPPVAVHPLPDPDPVRPPAYVVHTTAPVQCEGLIAPFTSTITPSATYLSDPLNAYAHLGLPKPFVHLIGPPLDLALDARIAGDSARYVRSGCRPNAVLRPVLCPRSSVSVPEEGASPNPQPKPPEEKEGTLGFAVFALRDLKAHEEVVLGWEWDDGHAIHQLPALIQTPGLFPPPEPSSRADVEHTASAIFDVPGMRVRCPRPGLCAAPDGEIRGGTPVRGSRAASSWGDPATGAGEGGVAKERAREGGREGGSRSRAPRWRPTRVQDTGEDGGVWRAGRGGDVG
ncbi:hypothetical protein FPV67DRAFT_224442 [Lyophyllum atratum]|nr:hypothetical protein FPV67DRAFT_224442 [Lyophyllum atratum]